MNRFIRPEEVANVIAFLASDESSAMTGQALNVTAGVIMT
jgi:NAD(P)-dependent dehydrogenase (short-subunit alcohol dehydrogenase family)